MIKTLRHRLGQYYRLSTAARRRLPDFLIIGAQKSGTSSLFALLSQHPQLSLSRRKEVHYFDWHFDKPLDWYRTWFPIDNGQLTGEATPIYMFHPYVAERVKSALPTRKFIVILRDPVDRAFAHYNMACQKGFEELNFEDALMAEKARVTEGLNELEHSNYSLKYQRYSYVSRGLYADQLKRWCRYHDTETLHVTFYEDLIKNTAQSYAEICSFLNIRPEDSFTLPHHNAHHYSPMQDATRQMLTERFSRPNIELEEFLGRKLPWPTT